MCPVLQTLRPSGEEVWNEILFEQGFASPISTLGFGLFRFYKVLAAKGKKPLLFSGSVLT